MSIKARAELVLVEPGATASPTAALRHGNEQRYVLLRAVDEPLHNFQQRVLRRTQAMRQAAQQLCHLTYFAGELQRDDWSEREELLAQLCEEIAPEGRVVVHAPGSVSTDVLGFIGDLRLDGAKGLELRAVFSNTTDATDMAEPAAQMGPISTRLSVREAFETECARSVG